MNALREKSGILFISPVHSEKNQNPPRYPVPLFTTFNREETEMWFQDRKGGGGGK